MKTRSRAILTGPFLITAGLLAILLGDRVFLRVAPAQTEAYHEGVRATSMEMPHAFGSWLGVDTPVPEAAVRMLHPNIILARRFHNIETGETISLLLVHVKDARDLLGHYPPVCYRGRGWAMDSAQAADWAGEEKRAVKGTEYQFSRDNLEGGSAIVVDNFFIMRGGTSCRDMKGVKNAARDRQRKFFGAAQVQVVHEGAVPPHRRRQVVEEVVQFLEPTLAAISAVK